MQMVQVNSLNKQEESMHIWPLWLTTQVDAQVHQFDCKGDLGAGYNIMPLYIYRSLFGEPGPLTVFTDGHGDSPVKCQGLCTAVLFTGCQAPQKPVFQVTDTRQYFIFGHETIQKIGYIHFPRITPPKLTQLPKTYAHLKAITARAPKYKERNMMDQNLRDKKSNCLMVKYLLIERNTTYQLPRTTY